MTQTLTTRQLFKAAYIAGCIENGSTTPQQVMAKAKTDNIKLAGMLSDLAATGKGLAGSAVGIGAPLMLAAPPIAGAALGGMFGKMSDIDDVDVERAKNEELIAELRRQTGRLNHRRTAEQFAKESR